MENEVKPVEVTEELPVVEEVSDEVQAEELPTEEVTS